MFSELLYTADCDGNFPWYSTAKCHFYETQKYPKSLKYLENTVFCLKGRKANPFLPTSVLGSKSEQTVWADTFQSVCVWKRKAWMGICVPGSCKDLISFIFSLQKYKTLKIPFTEGYNHTQGLVDKASLCTYISRNRVVEIYRLERTPLVLEDSEHGAQQLSAYVLLHPFILLLMLLQLQAFLFLS